MALSNTATPKYYGQFRDQVLRGEIPVNREISLEMNRIDELIENPSFYYDDQAIEGFVKYCERELTLTDGADLILLDTFKLWAEQLLSWYYFVDRSVYVPNEDNHGGEFVKKKVKKRLVKKQYLIVARGAAKSMYASFLQAYFLNVNTNTTHQITTAPTMHQADEVMSPIRTAITRSRGPLFQFLTEGSLQNTTGSRAKRVKLASTKKGIENFLTGSLLEVRPMSIDKLQGMRPYVSTIDEWLSGDVREDVVGAIEQGASKDDKDYVIVAISSEGTVRNGPGDTIKMELADILKGDCLMAERKKSSSARRPPAKTPEARENQLIDAAVNLAEQQILDGSASAQVITHYLKLASSREKLEQERLLRQIELEKAKAESIGADKRIEELYSNAMDAMRTYSGQEVYDGDVH